MWTQVSTRLPKEDGWYIVFAPSYAGGSSSGLKNIDGIMFSKYKNRKWSIEEGYHKHPHCVEAWMHLPKLPGDEYVKAIWESYIPYCGNCRYTLGTDMDFCPRCGTPVDWGW